VSTTHYKLAILFLLLSAAPAVFPQDCNAEIAAVKNLVDQCGPARSKTTLITRSLVKAEGKLAKFDAESLYFKRDRRYFRTLHRDVLEIRCQDRTVSHVPDPLTRPHGAWSDINQVYAGTKIVVVLTDGTSVKGMSNSASDTHIIMFDPETNARRDIPKDNVAAFIGVIGAGGGARSGAAKGSEGMLDVGRDPILSLAAAGIGAIIGAILKSDGRPVLVYSR
jgi:hypothetical protein